MAGVGAVAVAAAPTAVAEPPPGADQIDRYPVAQGRYTSPQDYSWVFFQTPDGRHCGIGPNGGPVGCDAVPMDAPDDTNQTVVISGAVAEYRHADTPSFTRDVDVLPEGHRLENWGASCGVGYQGTVSCKTYGHHGFTISSVYGVLW
jgi:hypothetical protein